MDMNLKDQIAIVTGGGSGLGAATAEEFASQGADVVVVDVNGEAATQVAARIGATAICCDLGSTDQIERAVEAVRKRGPIRVLANVAGVGGGARLIAKDGSPMPLSEFRRQIDINLVGTFDITRIVAAAMAGQAPCEEGERGVILFTASVAAYEGQSGQAGYAAAKGGLVSLTLPLARDLAQYGIRVASIAPGLFSTPMMQRLPQKIQDSLAASIPFPSRLGRPDEFARLARHIVENVHINGEVIRLDGATRLAAR